MSGKTSTASKAKYNAKAYDRIEIAVHKGTKAYLQEIAEKQGVSVASYIKAALHDKYLADTGEDIFF